MIIHKIISLLALLVAAGCNNAGSSTMAAGEISAVSGDRLIVSAAASLTDAFEATGARFREENAGNELIFNFAGSQQLAQQIAGGAPADIFASADLRQMQVAVSSGRIAETSVQPFAANRLVIIYPLDLETPLSSLQDLARPGLRLVLAAEQVPVGRYTHTFLENAAAAGPGPAYRRQVLDNVVSHELNVRAVLTRISLGEADAGIVYSSDVAGAQNAAVGTVEIPDELNVAATYYLALLAGDEENPLAHEFVDFVLSAEGQAILQDHGFTPINESPAQ